MFSHLFTRKKQAADEQQNKVRLLPRFHKIVVPASGTPFSHRAIRTACRIAGGCEDVEINLVYVMEVPRAFALTASLPGEEAAASGVLAEGAREVGEYGFTPTTQIQRGRDVIETLLKYAVTQEADLIVIGSRPDNVRGVPLQLAREIYDRASCPVVLDYIAGEVSAISVTGRSAGAAEVLPSTG